MAATTEFSEKKGEQMLGMGNDQNGSRKGMSQKGVPDHIVGDSDESGVTKDGMRLHPQPTSDPLDPLNWSSFKKHLILGIVMWK